MNPVSDTGAATVVDGWLRLCPAGRLVERGDAVSFDLPSRFGARSGERGFAIRFGTLPRAYVNRCAHVSLPLDWEPGQVFDPERRWLLCSVHGAEYEPDTGRCRSGPCRGRGHLEPLVAVERDGWIWIRIGPDAGVDRASGDSPEDSQRNALKR